MQFDFLERAIEILASGDSHTSVILAGNELISYLAELGKSHGIIIEVNTDENQHMLNDTMLKLNVYDASKNAEIALWLTMRTEVASNHSQYRTDQMKAMVYGIYELIKGKEPFKTYMTYAIG